MRIAFVGGKSSGKSTCAAVFSRYLAAKGLPVLAVDAAADRRLGALLGAAPPSWTAAHLRARQAGARAVFVLGPDGIGPLDGSPTGPSALAADGVRLVATDAHEVLLDHLADGPGEYVVVDLPAEGVAAARYDLTVLVAEPTRRSVGLYRRHAAAARAALLVLGNKTSDWGDAAWLTEQVGDASGTRRGCGPPSAARRARSAASSRATPPRWPPRARHWTRAGNSSRVARRRATLLWWSLPTRRAGGRSSCGPR
jgi:CO dehydrogenase maturation factor